MINPFSFIKSSCSCVNLTCSYFELTIYLPPHPKDTHHNQSYTQFIVLLFIWGKISQSLILWSQSLLIMDHRRIFCELVEYRMNYTLLVFSNHLLFLYLFLQISFQQSDLVLKIEFYFIHLLPAIFGLHFGHIVQIVHQLFIRYFQSFINVVSHLVYSFLHLISISECLNTIFDIFDLALYQIYMHGTLDLFHPLLFLDCLLDYLRDRLTVNFG